VCAIPNPIDTRVFAPKNKVECAELMSLPANKRLILFAAQRATNVNKGLAYLVEACNMLAQQYPDMKDNTALVVLGGKANQAVVELPLPVIPIDYVSDTATLIALYNAVHAFVLPSLSENLPNTIMEAMACGVPCVGFNVGGIPEEIDHRRNGYVARYRDAADLAKGIHWVLFEADYDQLATQAVKKVQANYSQQAVALQYIEVYNQALAFKKCML
jgi:group 1 glycosyl transferase